MFSLYRILTDLAAWPLRLVLHIRSWRGKEEPLRLRERRGLTAAVRPKGPLVWCHAASVGEAITFLPVINQLTYGTDACVLLTTGTVSSARLIAERLPDHVIHQFAPWDRRGWVARFLDHWQPDMAVRMESELWPNTLLALRDGQVPTVVINGRLSGTSARGWARFPQFSKDVFSCLTLVLAQTPEFAQRFKDLGAHQVETTENLKLASPALPQDEKDRSALKDMIDARPVWLAASTHPGEDEIVLEVHKRLLQSTPNLLTIVAPRHAHRGAAIARAAIDQGLSAVSRSSGTHVTSSTSVYVADTFGELGTLYALSPVVFVGKSLAVGGGQNPIEPIHFGCAILFGPLMSNFEDIATAMISDGMALEVKDASELASRVSSLLQDPDTRAQLAAAGQKLLERGQTSLDTTTSCLRRILTTEIATSHHDNNGR